MKPCFYLCLLLLLVSSAMALSPSETRRAAWWSRRPTLPDADFLAGLCSHQRGHPYTMRRLPWCQQLGLHATRRRLPMPPPGRDDGEEIDAGYGVSKRLVPTGPNPLHH